jgi:hypothetical protein
VNVEKRNDGGVCMRVCGGGNKNATSLLELRKEKREKRKKKKKSLPFYLESFMWIAMWSKMSVNPPPI